MFPITHIGSRHLQSLTATTTLSKAHANCLLLMGAAGAALTFKLPEATGTGDIYTFMVSVVNTSNYIVNVTTTDTIDGMVWTASTGDTPDLGQPWVTAATSDTVTLNGTTTGGVAIGDYLQCIDIADAQWAINGVTTTSGTEATPFSAAVS